MVKIIAQISLYKVGRKTPFVSGYRPLFNFVKEMKTSGQIRLLVRGEFLPGGSGIVEIVFVNSDFLGDDFGLGKKFVFGEGSGFIGEGEVIDIL